LRRTSTLAARAGCGLLAAWLAFGLVLTISRGAWLGLALALMAWPLFSARWSWGRRIGVAVASLGALLVVGAVLFGVSVHVRERLRGFVRDRGETSRPIMWRAAGALFREHPATGSGAGSYNVLFEKFRPEKFLNEPQWAHNDYLNTLSDYGAVGFTLSFGAAALIAWRCLRGPRREFDRNWLDESAINTSLGIGLLAFALQLLVDFHFKIPALAMAFATLAAMIVHVEWKASESPVTLSLTRRILFGGAALAVGCFVLFVSAPKYRAESLRYQAAQAIDRLASSTTTPTEYRATLTVVRARLARAVELDPSNAQAWSDEAYADSLWARVEPGQSIELGRRAAASAERALGQCQVAGEFWYRRGIARDMLNQWPEAGEDFAHALELSPHNARAWYYYAYHLSLNPRQHALAEAAVQFGLRLDPGNDAALALRQLLAISPKAP
jgi:tetratricopeptide (TPR) repeat protein